MNNPIIYVSAESAPAVRKQNLKKGSNITQDPTRVKSTHKHITSFSEGTKSG